MEKNSKIFVAGHRGLVGSAILRSLESSGFKNILSVPRSKLDLLDKGEVEAFFSLTRPEYVFLAAAKVGGINANNSFPADFIYDNLMIQANIIHAAFKYKTKKLLFLGSSCIYPKEAPQPIKEEYLMTGPLEPTNSAYAIAKIAGIEMCRAYNRQHNTSFIPVMPTNLYGPNDKFDLLNSHVLPAMIRKFHLARLSREKRFEEIKRDERIFGPIPADIKAGLGIDPDTDEPKESSEIKVVLWGTGKPKREFLFVDDLADACIFLMERYEGDSLINIGTGEDLSIESLAGLIASIIGYHGPVVFDGSKPDGTYRKLLCVEKLHGLGWRHRVKLEDGIKKTYSWYLDRIKENTR